jgi:hypothetical protein
MLTDDYKTNPMGAALKFLVLRKPMKFIDLKRYLAAQRFSNDDEMKTAVQHWVKTLAADFFDEGLQKLVPRYDKYLKLGGDYVEK